MGRPRNTRRYKARLQRTRLLYALSYKINRAPQMDSLETMAGQADSVVGNDREERIL
jgi:hypothetical protein